MMLTDISYVLADQADRDRFAQAIDSNFSVIAPAGVGKTTAIAQRALTFIEYALQTDPELVSQLVVVTYTQKAATEMLQRVRNALLAKKKTPIVFNLLNRAFFGTIHSFCLQLIHNYGYLIEIPGELEVLSDPQLLGTEFIRHSSQLEQLLKDPLISRIKKFIDVDELLSLALRLPVDIKDEGIIEPIPGVFIDPLLNFNFKRKPSENTLDYLTLLKEWKSAYEADSQAIGLPLEPSGPSDFKDFVFNNFKPIWLWLGRASLSAAKKIALLFQQFRLERRLITHDDIISLALKLTQNEDILAKIRAQDLRIILDEAQDTDQNQFSILLSIVKQTKNHTSSPAQGTFCMVGDPQQSIYSSRADLPTYMQIHKALIDSKSAHELTFTVTMRCDTQIVDGVNKLFPNILQPSQALTQASFVPLSARPWAGEGLVLKLEPSKEDTETEIEDPLQHEAKFLANWLLENNSYMGFNAWHQVAFLTPRKSWLLPIEKALKDVGIPCQIHSHDTINGDNPAYAWITALATILTNPFDSFEITGVLREIFGVSDHAIAHYVQQQHLLVENKNLHLHPINIVEKPESAGLVAECLTQLNELYMASVTLSVYDSICLCVERLELKKKIASLVFHDPQHTLDVLNAVLTQAACVETDGMDLLAFAYKLKKDFGAEKLPTTQLHNHLQLLTCHKAKGLEWPVVILPFLFKDITFPNNSFPQLYNIPVPDYPKVAICNHPAKQAYDLDLKHYRLSEIERLVYVAATRASQKLILVNDRTFFPNSKTSLANLLQILPEGPNNAYWETLPSTLQASNVFTSVEQSAPHSSLKSHLDPSAFTMIGSAYATATAIPTKRLPSKLSTHKVAISRHEFLDTNALQYGTWWHEMMAKMPWQGKLENWQKTYNECVSSTPDPLRAKKEFELLMNSSIVEWCQKKNGIIKTEVPIFSVITSRDLMEGSIDFLVFMPEESIPWIILDWKTDYLNAEQLRINYAPQLKAYASAIRQTYNQEVATYLYATRTGELIPVE